MLKQCFVYMELKDYFHLFLFPFFNVAARLFKITGVACILFLCYSAGLDC